MNEQTAVAGLIDLHVHSSPDVRPRYANDLQVARDAAGAGMAAILLKCHVFPTADRASIADEVVDGVQVFGSVVLNNPVGGLNPAAVRVTLQIGGRCVWMPTEDADNHRRRTGGEPGLTVLDSRGRLKPEVHEIVAMIAEHDAILATGHLAVEESVALVQLAGELGARKVVVTHPDSSLVQMPVRVQRELTAAGALMERCFSDTTDKPGAIGTADMADRIREVGVGSSVLTSDLGQPHNPKPVVGFALFVSALQACGLSEADIRQMAAINPARLLNMEGLGK